MTADYMDLLRKLRIEADVEASELMQAVYRRTRTYDSAGILRFGAFRALYCPICLCVKSGDPEIPNIPTEACETGDWHDCRCHDGWDG